MINFISYYWSHTALPSDVLTTAFNTLFATGSPLDVRALAFLTLLRSESAIARGLAYDQFSYAEIQGRHGARNPFIPFIEELRTRARAELLQPPVSGTTPTGVQVEGANHASALGVLIHLGDQTDLADIERVLRSSRDISVLLEGSLAARRHLADVEESHPPLLAILARIGGDADLPSEVRSAAIGALAGAKDAGADELLVGIATNSHLPEAAQAAHGLGLRDLERHRELLEQLSTRWPAEAGYAASEVRELLESPLRGR